MKDVGAEVTLFCATMRNVRSVFESPKLFRISTTALHDVHDVLSRGEAIFKKVEALLNKLRNDDEGADLYSRVEDMFRKSKVLMWKESLRSCTAMVQVMLTTMAFAERLASAGKGHSPSTGNDELRDLMQSLLLAQQSTNARLERLEDQTLLDEMQDTGSSNPNRLGPDLERGHRRNRSSRAILGIATDGTADLLSEGAQRTSILLNRKIYHENDFKESQRRTWTILNDHRQSLIQSNNLLQTWTDQLDPSPPYMLSFHGEYAADAYKLIELQEDIRKAERNRDRDRDSGANTEMERNSDISHEPTTTSYNDWDDGSSGARGESNDKDKTIAKLREGVTSRKGDEDGPRDGGGRREQANVEDRVPAIASPIQYPAMSQGQGFVTDTTPRVQAWQQVENPEPSVEIFKSFRVSLEDPCWKVLPLALRKYNIDSDARFYALWIQHGDQERYIEPQERPLAIFKDLESKGLKPMFMLKKAIGGTQLEPQLTSTRSRWPLSEDPSVPVLTTSLKGSTRTPGDEIVSTKDLAATETPSDPSSITGLTHESLPSSAPGSHLPSAETVFKDLRIGIDENCSRVLQKALQKHGVRDGIRNHAIWVEYDDVERYLGPAEMPLAMFRDLQREGKKPKFMLRKLPAEIIRIRQELSNLV